MKTLLAILLTTFASACASADVLLSRPQSSTGGLIASCWVPPDGSDADQYAWDTFSLPGAATLTEIQWQGDGFGNGAGFQITINGNAALPDQAGVLARYNVPGNAGQTSAGVINGSPRFTYHYVLTTPLHLTAGTTYWINIEGTNGWSSSFATGGSGSHIQFFVGLAMFLRGSGNPAFTLLGTPACVTPSITTQPSPTASCGGSASFSIASAGTGPLTYRWRKATVPMNIVSNPSAATATLLLTNATVADAVTYDCIITNSCGNVTSSGALLTVCAADFNCDRTVDFSDYLDFVDAFSSSLPGADFNADGVIDFFDYLDFVDAFSTGC